VSGERLLGGVAGFGQGNVLVKVEHRDSIERCLEVSLCRAYLVGFVCLWRRSRTQCSRWSTEGAQDRNRRVVCKLKNSLYGLKSAHRKLYKMLIPSW
jgi:hypothetical protein